MSRLLLQLRRVANNDVIQDHTHTQQHSTIRFRHLSNLAVGLGEQLEFDGEMDDVDEY